jgi:glutamine amidotransferase
MRQPESALIDYGVGNTHSVMHAIRSLGYRRLRVTKSEDEIMAADVLILPGVGAFDACMRNLREHRLDQTLHEAVTVKHKPILGICVGMQLMAEDSEENGRHAGLGWIPGHVVKLDLPEPLTVPHVGWNELAIQKETALFSRTDANPHFYFDHSYHFRCDDSHMAACCDYGIRITAAVVRDNIHGVQFHPEKSQVNGLKLFRGFFNSIEQC